ncbi:MAG TPA: polyprenyl synthetase family protein [Vicinamibacterales bacterium]|nr:polyprenyl synthetase family protein [Vicinamibacterales bacterium]
MTAATPSLTDDHLIASVFAEYGQLTQRHLRTYLPSGEPGSYLYDLIADYPRRGGKMLRPTLCLAAARAFGARAEDAVASAVSIELLHNALLIHDDIEDGSTERRGTPTLHELHGIPLALNAGDALGLLSLSPLADNVGKLGVTLALRIFEEAQRMARETTEGQALELGWCRDNRVDLTDEDYLTMVLKKTCWLTTIHPLRVGCLIGTRDTRWLDPLVRLGFFFGAAFQIQDDVLNLEGGASYGKELNGDLLEGKRTLMIIHAMREAAPDDRARVTRILAKPRRHRTARDVAWTRDLIRRSGGLTHARQVARGLAGAALFEFDQIFGGLADGRDAQFIRNLITWVIERTN